MKKFYFLFLFALIASISNLYAAEKTVTFDFSTDPGAVSGIKNGEITVSFDKKTGTTPPKWYSKNGGEMRAYANNTITVSSVKKIKAIKFTFNKGDGSNKITSTPTGFTIANSTWTGESVSVVFTIVGDSGHRKVKTIEVTYDAPDVPAVPSCGVPTFSVEEGTFTEAQTITLTPGEGGAQVFYTINGGTEQPFIEPIKLEEDGTYKIAAYTAGTETLAKSATVTKTYVINLPLEEPYILCEDAAWLTEGANIIFASSVVAGEQKAMSKLQKTKNRGVASVTIGSAFDAGKETVGIVSKDADVAVFTVGISNGHITFYTGDSRDEDNNSVAGYLYAASSSSSQLKTQDNVDANAEWTVAVAANGEATIKAQGGNTRNLMRYNINKGGDPLFSCYTSGQSPIYIYLLGNTSSVSSMSAEGVKVFAAEGGVEVVAAEATDVAVYTVAGQLVRQARVAEGNTLVNVAPGFYVVRANGTATKVIVR